MKRRTFARADIVVIICTFALFALMPGAALDEGAPDRLIATVGDGRPSQVLPLAPDRKIELKGPLGKTVLQTLDGVLRVLSSPCPNKICIRMGDASQSGQVLVCVPNRVSVRLAGGDGEGLDAVAR